MKKIIFEEMGGTYIRHGDYLIPLFYLAGGRRTEVYRHMGTKTFTLSERILQGCISEIAYKWKGE